MLVPVSSPVLRRRSQIVSSSRPSRKKLPAKDSSAASLDIPGPETPGIGGTSRSRKPPGRAIIDDTRHPTDRTADGPRGRPIKGPRPRLIYDTPGRATHTCSSPGQSGPGPTWTASPVSSPQGPDVTVTPGRRHAVSFHAAPSGHATRGQASLP